MVNVTTLSQPGFDGTTQDALFLRLFGSEVLASFEQATVMRDKHMVKQISEGKSVLFPAVGRASSSYHTEGEDLLSGSSYLTSVAHNEAVIKLDSLLTSSVFVPEIQSLKNHWGDRAEYSRQIGFALGTKFDEQVIKVLGLCAREAAKVSGELGSLATTDKQVTAANMKTSGSDLFSAIFDAAEKMDEMSVPKDGRRWCIVTPAMYYNLLQVAPSSTSSAAATDVRVGGQASITQGSDMPIPVAGINVVSSLNIDTASATVQESGTNTNYEANDNSNVAGYVFHEGAVGTGQLKSMALTSDWIPQNLGYLITGRLALGHGVLRPSSCIELNTVAFT